MGKRKWSSNKGLQKVRWQGEWILEVIVGYWFIRPVRPPHHIAPVDPESPLWSPSSFLRMTERACRSNCWPTHLPPFSTEMPPSHCCLCVLRGKVDPQSTQSVHQESQVASQAGFSISRRPLTRHYSAGPLQGPVVDASRSCFGRRQCFRS